MLIEIHYELKNAKEIKKVEEENYWIAISNIIRRFYKNPNPQIPYKEEVKPEYNEVIVTIPEKKDNKLSAEEESHYRINLLTPFQRKGEYNNATSKKEETKEEFYDSLKILCSAITMLASAASCITCLVFAYNDYKKNNELNSTIMAETIIGLLSGVASLGSLYVLSS